MYRSQLELDLLNPSVQQALRNSNDMHRNLMSAFHYDSGEDVIRNSLLYQLMNYRNKTVLYVISKFLPDWTKVPGFTPISGGEPRDITSLQNVFSSGCRLQFRLIASPTKKRVREGKLSNRVFLRTSEERETWLFRQAEKSGFRVLAFYEEKQVRVSGNKNGNRINYTGVVFTGTLEVTEPELFWKAYCTGIGPGKAYGLGMLMVMR